ncbi:MAG TPA: translation initiation factor IF-2 N-terminal domain-containing protein, partial [Pyrinomonadaceae bacterium]
MTVSSKVRLYDLAKDLKLDTKRLIEEVRREGVDVSVPSNSVSKELAEKIRNKYFPKKEVTAQRVVKVVKRQRPVEEDAPALEEESSASLEPAPEVPLPAEQPASEPAQPVMAEQQRAPGNSGPVVVRQVKRLTPPATRAEPPA